MRRNLQWPREAQSRQHSHPRRHQRPTQRPENRSRRGCLLLRSPRDTTARTPESGPARAGSNRPVTVRSPKQASVTAGPRRTSRDLLQPGGVLRVAKIPPNIRRAFLGFLAGIACCLNWGVSNRPSTRRLAAAGACGGFSRPKPVSEINVSGLLLPGVLRPIRVVIGGETQQWWPRSA